GAVSGRRRIYDWSSAKGRVAFALDSTWALATTTAGLVAHAVAATQPDAGYSDALSRRQNRHVYGRGFRIRKGFAITLGNVVNGAGDVARARRTKLVTDHEDVHVWQARWFGPLYPFLYGGWMVSAAVAATLAWPIIGRGRPWSRCVETCAYYLNPFEWWAYSRDDHWPPSGKLEGMGWQRPVVRSFASRRPAPTA
ncbi:MAG: hypothetical protein CL424_13980, partial [Acidimicrobiaceae bacterium]|nr:hypothetical protein [Acidimicrobiaceae bacterium]